MWLAILGCYGNGGDKLTIVPLIHWLLPKFIYEHLSDATQYCIIKKSYVHKKKLVDNFAKICCPLCWVLHLEPKKPVHKKRLTKITSMIKNSIEIMVCYCKND